MSEPMTDERLAELENWASRSPNTDGYETRIIGELVAEVRRLRELVKVNFDLYHETMRNLRRTRNDSDLTKLGLAELEEELVKVRASVDRVRELFSGSRRHTAMILGVEFIEVRVDDLHRALDGS